MAHVVVDPVTRIEGHLRIEAEVDGGAVKEAWSSSTMFRGIELILRGRDPRDAWAFAQRICGVCTTVHAIASIRPRRGSANCPAASSASSWSGSHLKQFDLYQCETPCSALSCFTERENAVSKGEHSPAN